MKGRSDNAHIISDLTIGEPLFVPIYKGNDNSKE